MSDCATHKFTDDVTLSEIIKKHDCSNISAYLSNVFEWSDDNRMNIIVAKTKEMLLGRIIKEPPPNIYIRTGADPGFHFGGGT